MVAQLIRLGLSRAGGAARVAPKPLPKMPAPMPLPAPTKPAPTATAPAPLPLPVPPPVPKLGNTPPLIHVGKEKEEKEDCKEALKKYPVHPYREASTYAKDPDQSHHVVQNAQFWDGDKADASVCAAYNEKDAPCIPLGGPSTDRATPHGKVTQMQAADSKLSRATKTPVTYKDATANSKKQLKAAGLTDKEVGCVMTKVDEMLKKMCPALNDSTVLRTPKR